LISNQKITTEKPAIVDVAPTVLKLFGLGLPGHFDGKAWNLAESS
jgi:arylsulfatase A-like enzyme